MAYRYRRRFGRSRYRRGYYPRKSIFRRKTSRMMRQLDTNRMIINGPTHIISLGVQSEYAASSLGNSSSASPVYIIDPTLDLLGGKNGSKTVTRDPTFQAFCNLFDEFKINAIRVKVQMYSTPNANNNSNIGATFIRYAIDLNGFSAECNDYSGWQSPIKDPVKGNQMSNLLSTYSSFGQQTMNNNALYPIWKTFYPRGNAKGQWLGASWGFGDNANHNPRIDFTFKPIIFFQVVSPIATSSSSNYTCTFSYDVDYDITFKGQRRPEATA